MNGYLLSIIGTVLFSSFIVAILPEGKMSGTIKGVAKMVCLLAIIAPIPQYMQKQKNLKNTEEVQNFFSITGIQSDVSFIQYYSEMRIKDAEQLLEREIQEKFSYQADVLLKIDDTYSGADAIDIKIACIYLCIPNAESEMEAQIQMYLVEKYGCEVLFE